MRQPLEQSLQKLTEDLNETWAATELMPVARTPLLDFESPEMFLIKKETDARILLTEADQAGRRLCLKIYQFPGKLRWRYLFSAPRVKREFENMVTCRNLGIPVPEPVSWCELRSLGLQKYNAIATVYEPLRDLGQVLSDIPEGESRRVELIEAAGKLLAQMHRSGVVWATPFPRNILVNEDRGTQLLAFDMPYACKFKRALVGGRPAAYDLELLIRFGLNQSNFESQEALQLLKAYSDDDSACRTLVQTLRSRTSLGRFMDRIFVRSLANAKAGLRLLRLR
jgi:tRNA A-37 threonylcarbamoyl transferase component Bud32